MPLLNALPGGFFERIEQKSIKGTADIIGCLNGRYVRLEAKRSEHEATKPLQAYLLEKAGRAGAYSRRIDPENWPLVYEDLKRISANLPEPCIRTA